MNPAKYDLILEVDGKRRTLEVQHWIAEYGVCEQSFWKARSYFNNLQYMESHGDTFEQAIENLGKSMVEREDMLKIQDEAMQKMRDLFRRSIETSTEVWRLPVIGVANG